MQLHITLSVVYRPLLRVVQDLLCIVARANEDKWCIRCEWLEIVFVAWMILIRSDMDCFTWLVPSNRLLTHPSSAL